MLDIHLTETLTGASVSIIFRILGAIAQFSFTLILARIFGAEGMGIFVLGLTTVAIGSAFARWGIDQAALKHISIYATNNQWGDITSVYKKSIIFVLITSIAMSFFIYLLAPWIAGTIFHDPRLVSLIEVFSLSIIPFSLLFLISECLRALKKIASHTLTQVFAVPAISSTILLLLYRQEINLHESAYIYFTACMSGLIIAYFIWLKSVNADKPLANQKPISLKELLITASPMAWVTILSIVISFLETILLGIYHDAEEVGIYAVVLRLALIVNFVIVAFNSILAPKFASLYRHNQIPDIQKLVSNSVYIMTLATLPIFIFYLIYPSYALLLFGDEFLGAEIALIILTFGQFVNIYAGPAAILLMMTGHQENMRKNTLISFSCGLITGIILIPILGVVGAAISATLGIVLLNILAVVSVHGLLGIHMPLSRLLFLGQKNEI
jgi:O-antigen/teichoic acid export membrane protein